MKKLLSIFLFATLLSTFTSCKNEEEMYYEGESLLHFDTTAQKANVIKNTNSADYTVSYGVTKPASVDSNVELVFNAAKSTAVLGTDFTIVQGTNVLPAGAALGGFKINVKESAAKLGKKAYFTVKSSSLSSAVFNQEVEVTFTLICPPDTFPGSFKVVNVLFGQYNTEIVLGTTANTLILKDYIEIGYDITVNYNPLTGEISLPAASQPTGYINGANGMIFIKPAVDGSKGSVDFCNRMLNLRLSYGTPTGATYTSGGQTSYFDVFTGL
ncbi:hypothetical protein [Chryseobacterium indoltheticum]|uniref:hypothetical protein n=1 Tax=Chryseobacterium indoltheticum TaxID=254 RepID=UPI0040430953